MQQTRDIIKKVRKIEISTKQLVDGLISGNYHSIFKGQGIEFSEIRDYRPGDDVRAIDWKVTARFNHPYIKEFIEERDLQVYFAIDMSASGSFGSDISKQQKAFEVAATLMFAALRNNDNVGMFLFTDRIEKFIPARKGRRHVLKLLSTLLSCRPETRTTDIKESLAHISKVVKRRGILFIISDFFSDDFAKPLKTLRSRQDIIPIRITDLREKEMPDIGLIELEDEETGEQMLVDTSDRDFRENYARLVRQKESALRRELGRMKIDMVEVGTDEAPEIPLKRFFKTRKIRVMR